MIDTETTGFSHQDRVIEIACLRLGPDGSVLDHLCTLVNPGGAVDATFVHGITDADVENAPVFDEVATEITRISRGALLVAHNAPFDARMLAAEFARIDHVLSPTWMCTMRMRGFVGLPGPAQHKLAWAAWQEGLDVRPDHHAYQDAVIAGALTHTYLSRARVSGLRTVADLLPGVRPDLAGPLGFPALAGRAGRLHGRGASGPIELPVRLAGEDTDGVYRALLDEALQDFLLSNEEVKELQLRALHLGLSREALRKAHLEHLELLVDRHAADHHVDWAEQQQARAFATAVGLRPADLDGLLRRHADEGAQIDGPAGTPSPGTAAVPARPAPAPDGKVRVAFTGALGALSRAEAKTLAESYGMTVTATVSRRTDLLVTNVPETPTGKQQKAREHGTILCDEQTFLSMCGAPPITADLERVLAALQMRRTVATEAAKSTTKRSAVDTFGTSDAAQAAAGPEAPGPLLEVLSDGTQVLWCAHGGHQWSRPGKRGRAPRHCHEHSS